MKISKEIYNSVKQDCITLIRALNFDLVNTDKGKTGIMPMYYLLDKISHDRAYSDNHPGYRQGVWKRILPFDGRKFCFYYENGCNDNHIKTMLKNIQKELLTEI